MKIGLKRNKGGVFCQQENKRNWGHVLRYIPVVTYWEENAIIKLSDG